MGIFPEPPRRFMFHIIIECTLRTVGDPPTLNNLNFIMTPITNVWICPWLPLLLWLIANKLSC